MVHFWMGVNLSVGESCVSDPGLANTTRLRVVGADRRKQGLPRLSAIAFGRTYSKGRVNSCWLRDPLPSLSCNCSKVEGAK